MGEIYMVTYQLFVTLNYMGKNYLNWIIIQNNIYCQTKYKNKRV